jgi:hypothetical protein
MTNSSAKKVLTGILVVVAKLGIFAAAIAFGHYYL